jgi:hypothetical protein
MLRRVKDGRLLDNVKSAAARSLKAVLIGVRSDSVSDDIALIRKRAFLSVLRRIWTVIDIHLSAKGH